ncbi:hypothetical protein [Niveispirillum fermenti]|uniref:hypothetical protein n=1 Tax=Niveispirillum fermenti TaxID=1233113 RepID=UPI003A8985E8
MHPLRHFLLNHRLLAGVVMMLALSMKLMVPPGFMPVTPDGQLGMSICWGAGPKTADLAGKADNGKPVPSPQGTPCAFASLSMLSLAAVAAILAFALLQPVITRGPCPSRTAPPSIPARLRPPLRAPPLPV